MQKGSTILIIDDAPPVLESIADYLEDRGYHIFKAENGRDGLGLFDRHRPDKDGSTLPMLFHMAPIKKENETVGYRGVAVDITDELALKDHLRQAQKMEAVGQLAGGIAHDLNNMLSPILGFSEMLFDDLDEKDERRESVFISC